MGQLIVAEDAQDQAVTGKRAAPSNSHQVHRLLQKGPSPINISILADVLLSYPDCEAARYLQDGFTFGFRIPVQGVRVSTMANNLKSIRGMALNSQQTRRG